MTPEQIEIERKAFSEWALGQGIETELWMPSQPQCGYQNVRTNDYWAGWLARAEKAQIAREVLERIVEVLDRGNVVPAGSDHHKAIRAALEGSQRD